MRRLLLLLAVLAGTLLAGTLLAGAPAAALPPGGAGADTPGTSASVSPSTLRAGAPISFRVSGFPAGEIVYVKIDDGRFCSQKGVHGACVVHQQRISSGGTVSGSFVLSADLAPGRHWLRFLASKEMKDAQGNYLGVKGFTSRGNSDFTVVGGSAGSSGGSGTSGAGGGTGTGTGGAPTTGATGGGTGDTVAGSATGSDDPGAVVAAGRVLTVRPPAKGSPAATPTQSPTPTPAPSSGTEGASAAEAGRAVRPVRATTREQSFPVVGTLGLVLLGGLAAGWVLRTRRARG